MHSSFKFFKERFLESVNTHDSIIILLLASGYLLELFNHLLDLGIHFGGELLDLDLKAIFCATHGVQLLCLHAMLLLEILEGDG